jgi:ABC-type phosphate/phosphonate transport system ATPase subunit
LALDELLGKNHPSLEEVYVPLRAKPKQGKNLDRKLVNVAEVIHRAERSIPPAHILILGQPGAGKSTLLRQLTLNAIVAPQRVGVFSVRGRWTELARK